MVACAGRKHRELDRMEDSRDTTAVAKELAAARYLATVSANYVRWWAENENNSYRMEDRQHTTTAVAKELAGHQDVCN